MAKLIFEIPAGFKVPENTQDDQEFDSVATFKLEDGKLCLVAVDGAELEGYDKKEAKDDGEPPADFIGAVEKGMGGGMMGKSMMS